MIQDFTVTEGELKRRESEVEALRHNAQMTEKARAETEKLLRATQKELGDILASRIYKAARKTSKAVRVIKGRS
jgi:hypothetical protein